MWSIGQNIRAARKKKKLSQSELSILCGWGHFPARISNYERDVREPKSDDLLKLARILEVSIDWFYHTEQKKPGCVKESRVTYASLRLIPVIPWSEVLVEAVATKPRDYEGYERIVVDNSISDQSYVLRVETDTMEAPHGDSFPKGALILVDPSLEPQDNDYVIVGNLAEKEVSFKQLISDGSKRYLKPLNPRYPLSDVTESSKIFGVVHSMRKHFYKDRNIFTVRKDPLFHAEE